MKLTPLGDQAVLAYLADEPAAVALAATVRAADPAWLFDVVPAYASVGVFFDADQIRAADVMDWLNALASGGRGPAEAVLGGNAHSVGSRPPLAFRVPVCYEMQLDLPRVCEHTGLSADAVIERHTATVYTVYAVGFVPGFPYLGYLPSELCGVGRLPSPRTRVEPGSVGLTGCQTGIYPLARPGGWNLIGRTPLTIVDAADGFFPLRVGDTVRFERIDEARYRQLEGERLEGGRGG
ncbi:allophanate hydrolase subunit 1 [Gemmata sp. JC673]|uniref:Allophanate hydrolase subunit 1 n=1 Tax=Gemmata algarum TaxID=2975278 RepID=A0ABU5EZP5_9BACT|nr:carboxyltransferase domain-containing protein [Gemmata algarum]MDY3559980.1 allophanate hydrolase subunit 1 [Gemmata algarum]